MNDGQIVYTNCTRLELIHALQAIDRVRYPVNFANLMTALKALPEVEAPAVQAKEILEPITLRMFYTLKGRTARPTYWKFGVLLFIGLGFIVGLGEEIAGLPKSISVVLSLLVAWPQAAFLTRRFHDLNMSGWWAGATYFVAIAFAIATGVQGYWPEAVLACLAGIPLGTRGDNRYGPAPQSSASVVVQQSVPGGAQTE